jgi:hypothetical protein
MLEQRKPAPEPHSDPGQSLTDESMLCYNSARAWTDARRRDSLRTVFGGLSYCPFRAENQLYSVERIEPATRDSRDEQQGFNTVRVQKVGCNYESTSKRARNDFRLSATE